MILVAGLPGTGKALVAEVLYELGSHRITTEQSQQMTKLCKSLVEEIAPSSYPYYRSFSDIEHWLSLENRSVPEGDVMIVPFIAAIPSLLHHDQINRVIYCHREHEPWMETARRAEPTRAIDFDAAWQSSVCLQAELEDRWATLSSFNVDAKYFGGYGSNILNTTVLDLLDDDPELGMRPI